MSESPAPVRQDLIAHPHGIGVTEPEQLRNHIQSAARERDELLAGGAKLVDEAEEEFGTVSDEAMERVRQTWRAD